MIEMTSSLRTKLMLRWLCISLSIIKKYVYYIDTSVQILREAILLQSQLDSTIAVDTEEIKPGQVRGGILAI